MSQSGGRHFSSYGHAPTWLKIVTLCLVAVMLGIFIFGAFSYLRLNNNLASVDIGETNDYDETGDPIQILVLGSDTRTGSGNESYGSDEDSSGSGNSDVMMLVQVSGDRQRVSAISLPRDLMVPIPSCTNPETGEESQPQEFGMLNMALSEGGPACTVKVVNNMTGLQIDHFIMADFNAVKEITSAIGGVKVCLTDPVDDKLSGLSLPSGQSTIEGEQALAFLRTRHGFGDGSDTGRIQAQQYFLNSMARKVIKDGTLTDAPTLYSLADIVTKNMTVDNRLGSIPAMISMAERLQNVKSDKIEFATVPNEPYIGDPNRLQLKEPDADTVFDILKKDGNLTDYKPSEETASGTPQQATDQTTVPDTMPGSTANSNVGGQGYVDLGTAQQGQQLQNYQNSSSTSSKMTARVTAQQQSGAAAVNYLFGNFKVLNAANTSVDLVNASGKTDQSHSESTLKDAGYANIKTQNADEQAKSVVAYNPKYGEEAADIAERLGLTGNDLTPDSNISAIKVTLGKDNFGEGAKETSSSSNPTKDSSGNDDLPDFLCKVSYD